MFDSIKQEQTLPGRERIARWFDSLEDNLEAEAKQAGLLEHGSMIGSAREFLVRRVLKSFLPPVLHIGSGKIIDARGSSSRQIDVIIYDSRFPVFELENANGLYPIEGVLGVIEVKSTITPFELKKSLENIASVLRLTPHLQGEKPSASDLDGKRRIVYLVPPALYVFGFNSKQKMKGLANCVEKWFDDSEKPTIFNGLAPMLPGIIIAGKAVGLRSNGPLTLTMEEKIQNEWKEKHGPDVKHLMSFWDTDRRFGWLASSLLFYLSCRIKAFHATLGFNYTINDYIPWELYWKQHLEGKLASHSPWKPD